MSESSEAAHRLHQAIQASAGFQHLNRSHARTFSLNIFKMNAQEVLEITRRVNDPDEGLRLMALANREAGQQTHREVNRRVHNFVAASLTLVEHTRAFMRENYDGKPVLDSYQVRITAEFVNVPLPRFVQDLRNYMLHKGLPDSEMFLDYRANPQMPDGGGELTTGIRFSASKLLSWDGWTAPARTFLEDAGEYVDISAFVDAYTQKVLTFHEWLQRELDRAHADDIVRLAALQQALAELEASKSPTAAPGSVDAPNTPASAKRSQEPDFEFTRERVEAINAAGIQILGKVRQIEFANQQRTEFPSDRPVGATLTDKEIIETPLFWGNDAQGRRVFVFIRDKNESYGLDESDFAEIRTLV